MVDYIAIDKTVEKVNSGKYHTHVFKHQIYIEGQVLWGFNGEKIDIVQI